MAYILIVYNDKNWNKQICVTYIMPLYNIQTKT